MIKQFTDKNLNNQNTYVVSNNNNAIMIDASTSVEEAIQYILDNNLNLHALIITHGHWNHLIGLNTLLAKFPDVKVYINEWDKICLTSTEHNLSKYRQINFTVTEPINNLIPIQGSKNICEIGYEIQLKHIPGYTPGSQYILIKELQAIFIGDTIFKNKISFHDIPYCDMEYFKNSLIQIMMLDDELLVYPGHHESFSLKEAIKNNNELNEFLQIK